MKNTKKLLALVLALALVITAFAGCAGGGSGSSTSSTGGSTGGDGKLDTSKEVEIVMYFISDRPAKQDDIDAYMNEIFKEKLNCTLKENWIAWSDYANKYPLLWSSGEVFDLAYTATWLGFTNYAAKGAFMQLDELWPTYAPNNWAKTSEAAKTQATFDGHLICIPTLLATYSAYGPYYRTVFEDGAVTYEGEVTNFEEYEAYMEWVQENTSITQPYQLYSSGLEVDDMFYGYKGLYPIRGTSWLTVDPYADTFTLVPNYDNEYTMEYLEMTSRWCEKGFWSKSALSDTDNTKVQNGIAATAIHNVDTYQSRYIEKPEWGWKFTNFVEDVSNLPFTQDACVVSTTSKNPERALALYDLITTDETAYRAFQYGIEGTSYEVIDDQVKMINTDNYGGTGMWAARTTGLNLPSYGAPEDITTMKADWDAYIEKTGNKQSQYLSAWIPDTTSIETEYAACTNVIQQYWWPLECGFVEDLEAGLAEYKAQMQAAGADKVIETLQKQLDDFCASHPQG